jgi:ribosomal protein S27E
MVSVTDKNRQDLEHGFMCPKCGGSTNTYRHVWAKRWCPACGFVLREEGDRAHYDYRKYLIKKEKRHE